MDNDCGGDTDEGMDKDGDGIPFCFDNADVCTSLGNSDNISLTFMTDQEQHDVNQEVIINGNASTVLSGEIVSTWIDVDSNVDSDGDGCNDNDDDIVGLEGILKFDTPGIYNLTAWAKDGFENYQKLVVPVIIKPHKEFDKIFFSFSDLQGLSTPINTISI